MLNLSLTTDKLGLVTTSTANLDVHVSFANDLADAMLADKQNTTIASAVASPGTDIKAAPATGRDNIKFISIVNRHATTANTVTPLYNANGTVYFLTQPVILLAGESLICREGIWFHYDVNMGVYGQSLPVASDTVVGGIALALQTDMEAGTDLTKAVTAGRLQFHPSANKAWLRSLVTGAVPALTANYNITSLTDTATGDLGITIATDFSGAGVYSVVVGAEGINQTGAEANRRNVNVKFGTLAAGTVSLECWNTTTITSALVDPNTWHAAMQGDQA